VATTCPKCRTEVEVTRSTCGACGTALADRPPDEPKAPPPPDSNIGQLIDRKYKLIALLGVGGMGMVYRAKHEVLRKEVAIKILSPAVSGDENVRERFLREARVLAGLQHAHIVAATDAGIAGGKNLYIVMELVEGESLADHLGRGPLAWPLVVRIAKEVASALICAHQKGLVHRDLKPANVMLEKDTERAKVLDFGIARVVEGDDVPEGERVALTRAGTGIGTLPYMSPEQLLGDKIDARTDIYAFGVVLYEMLTGARPLRAETQQKLFQVILSETPPGVNVTNPKIEVPPWLEKMIFACLEKEAGARPQTMQDVLSCLEDQRAPGEEKQPRARVSGGGGGGAGPSAAVWILLGLFFLGGFAVAGWFGFQWVSRKLGFGKPTPSNNGAPPANVTPPANHETPLAANNGVPPAGNTLVPPPITGDDVEAKRRADAQAKAEAERKVEAERKAEAERAEAARKGEEDEKRRKAEEEARARRSSVVTQLQEFLAKKDLEGALGLVPAMKDDSTARAILDRDLPAWEKLAWNLSKLSPEAPALERAAVWGDIQRAIPVDWTLPKRAARDIEAAALEQYNHRKFDDGNANAQLALALDGDRHIARQIRATYLINIRQEPHEAEKLLGPFTTEETAPKDWPDNTILWARALLVWESAPAKERRVAIERIGPIADGSDSVNARKARALYYRGCLREQVEDLTGATEDLQEALEQLDLPTELVPEGHRILARVIWSHPKADARARAQALSHLLEAAKREEADHREPHAVKKFLGFLGERNDKEGFVALARKLLVADDLHLPAELRYELCYYGARAAIGQSKDDRERLQWLDEAILLSDKVDATDENRADLHSMRGFVLHTAKRFAEAKKDLAALKKLVERYADEGGNWDAYRTKLEQLTRGLSGK